MPYNADLKDSFWEWLRLQPTRARMLVPTAILSWVLSTFIYGALFDFNNAEFADTSRYIQNRIFTGFVWVATWPAQFLFRDSHGSAYAIVAIWLSLWFIPHMTWRYIEYRRYLRDLSGW